MLLQGSIAVMVIIINGKKKKKNNHNSNRCDKLKCKVVVTLG